MLNYEELRLLLSDPIKVVPTDVFFCQSYKPLATITPVFLVLKGHFPHTVSQPALAQKTTLTSSCKLRSNKCFTYNRVGFFYSTS